MKQSIARRYGSFVAVRRVECCGNSVVLTASLAALSPDVRKRNSLAPTLSRHKIPKHLAETGKRLTLIKTPSSVFKVKGKSEEGISAAEVN